MAVGGTPEDRQAKFLAVEIETMEAGVGDGREGIRCRELGIGYRVSVIGYRVSVISYRVSGGGEG